MLKTLFASLTNARFGPASVTNIERITLNMLRVTLKGELVRDYPDPSAGAHFKMIVPELGQSQEAFRDFVAEGKFKPAMRTYTIRHARQELGEIDVDIVVHGDLGRVGPWAQRAVPGDEIVISKCGSPKLITKGMTDVLAAADMTGFPALAAGLETLPKGIIGKAYVEILSDEDRQPVIAPPGIELNWIVKSDPHKPGTEIIEAMTSASPPSPTTSVFVAGEYSTVAALRRHFRKDHPVDKAQCYISSYWKAGLIEPEHQAVKSKAA